MKVLFWLEKIGVTIFNELDDYKQPLQSMIGIDSPAGFNSFSTLNMWLQGRTRLRPTWRHFVWALREIQLSHCADQIEYHVRVKYIEQPASSSNFGPTPESEEPEGREEENQREEGEPNL